jgi:hypothetical protein
MPPRVCHMLIGVFVALSLAACGGTAAPTATTVAPTVTPPPTPSPAVSTPTSAPTATPAPTATATAAITTTTAPTATRTPVPGAILAARATANASDDTFVDLQGRFQFVKPKGWLLERQPDPDFVVQLNTDRPPGSFSVAIESVVPGLTLARYMDAGLAQVQQSVTGYQPGPRGRQQITLDREPAELIDYFAMVGNVRLYFQQVIALRDDTAYVLTFNTQPNDQSAYFSQAQTVLDTWRFL